MNHAKSSASSLHQFRIVVRMSEGLVGADTECGRQMWVRTKSGTRKAHRCIVCQEPIPKGSLAYLPITNGYNRMVRVCVKCVEGSQEEEQ